MIISEIIIPSFAHILEEHYKRCENVSENDIETIEDKCRGLWLALDAMSKLTSTFGNEGQYASIACINERRKAADYIKSKIGIDPILEKDFAKWRYS